MLFLHFHRNCRIFQLKFFSEWKITQIGRFHWFIFKGVIQFDSYKYCSCDFFSTVYLNLPSQLLIIVGVGLFMYIGYIHFCTTVQSFNCNFNCFLPVYFLKYYSVCEPKMRFNSISRIKKNNEICIKNRHKGLVELEAKHETSNIHTFLKLKSKTIYLQFTCTS